jgi:hypothetical protein
MVRDRIEKGNRHVLRNLFLAALIGGVVGAGVLLWLGPSFPKNLVAVSCSNSSKDAGTLNHAINHSDAGDEILISGTCDLTSPVVIVGQRSYVGSTPNGSILRSNSTLPFMVANASYANNETTPGQGFTISNLTIDCNGGDRGLVIRASQVSVSHVHVENCANIGVLDTNLDAAGSPELSGDSKYDTFNDLRIENCGNGFWAKDTKSSVTNGILSNSTIEGSKHTAMDVDDAAGWTIEGNHALTTSGDGIFVARMYATRVSGNYIEDFADLSQGIDAQSQPNTASEISGNEVFNEASKAPGSFIRVTVARGAATVGVTDNVIHGVGLGVGLDYRALVGTSLKVTSSGNVVSNVGKKLKTTRGVTVDSGM